MLGYWAPYSNKEYLNRIYYTHRYSPYQKSSSTSTHPYAFSKPNTPNGSSSSFSSYPTTPTVYPGSLNGSTSSFDGTGMSLGAGHYGSTSSLSPTESPVTAGFLRKGKSGRRKKRSQPINSSSEQHVTVCNDVMLPYMVLSSCMFRECSFGIWTRLRLS